MIDTYIINLKEEINNFHIVKNKLKQKKFKKIFRFNAIYGKKIKNFKPYDKFLTSYFKYFGPFGAMGSALSHYKLLENIYNKTLKYNKSSLLDKYVLILEDDVSPNYNYNRLENIVHNIPNDADVLILHSFEHFIKYKKTYKEEYILKNNLLLASPCCSYLVKIRSIPKFLSQKLYTYYDAQHFNFVFNNNKNVYIYKDQFFNTDYTISHNVKDNFLYTLYSKLINYFELPDYLFWTLFKTFRIPFLNYELNTIEINFIGFILISIIIIKYRKYIASLPTSKLIINKINEFPQAKHLIHKLSI